MALELELIQWQYDLKTIHIQYNWYSNENN